ncbi:TVP38/TMEM64 family protein [Sutcliffiella horikoshii]|uniref:TVP38/TMEM64 family protein n=1 Tax=Sutcliffiella horikoshii TaxID=79883 RepID=UPI001F2146F8|nr:TVP38/TMEM64 family protein [Sutcliffiella horikoshii]MCG1023694.1 TVP38/TMEM64 family protein [Sutcliffiella horikoshii]
MSRKTIAKLLLLAIVISVLLVINYRYVSISPSSIREWILGFGVWAPIIYIILYTVRPLVLFPASVLSLGAGLAFGALWGTIYTIIGASSGAVLSFMVARKLGKNLAKTSWKGKAASIQQNMEKRGFFYILILRLLPIVNFDLISYVAGISKVRFIHFLLGTVLGIIPGTFAFNFLGSSFVEGDYTYLLIAVVVFVLIAIIPIFFKERFKKFFN